MCVCVCVLHCAIAAVIHWSNFSSDGSIKPTLNPVTTLTPQCVCVCVCVCERANLISTW